MANMWKSWLRRLWGVSEPPTTIEPPVDVDACEKAGAVGGGACGDRIGSPHTYRAGHEVDWGGPLDRPENVIPRTSRMSIH